MLRKLSRHRNLRYSNSKEERHRMDQVTRIVAHVNEQLGKRLLHCPLLTNWLSFGLLLNTKHE